MPILWVKKKIPTGKPCEDHFEGLHLESNFLIEFVRIPGNACAYEDINTFGGMLYLSFLTMDRISVLRYVLVSLLSLSLLTHSVAYTWTEDTSVGIIKHWNQITSSSDGTKLAATCFDDGDNFPDVSGSIYTSNNSGVTWTEVTSTGIKKSVVWHHLLKRWSQTCCCCLEWKHLDLHRLGSHLD